MPGTSTSRTKRAASRSRGDGQVGKRRPTSTTSSSPRASSRRSKKARRRGRSPGSRASASSRTTSAAGATTGRNALYLALTGLERGYADPRWGGYRQIQEAGGHVRKGERDAHHVRRLPPAADGRDEQGKPVLDDAGAEARMGPARPPARQAPPRLQRRADRGPSASAASDGAGTGVGGPRARRGADQGQRRAGRPRGRRPRLLQPQGPDRVVLPERSQFPSQDAYTHTALHELGHATGHPSRLNRATLVEHGASAPRPTPARSCGRRSPR